VTATVPAGAIAAAADTEATTRGSGTTVPSRAVVTSRTAAAANKAADAAGAIAEAVTGEATPGQRAIRAAERSDPHPIPQLILANVLL
jgi:hypothetical protein